MHLHLDITNANSLFQFSRNVEQRKFSKTCYYQDLENGEQAHRDLIIYSVSNKSVDRFCCQLFDLGKSIMSDKREYYDRQHPSLTLRS